MNKRRGKENEGEKRKKGSLNIRKRENRGRRKRKGHLWQDFQVHFNRTDSNLC